MQSADSEKSSVKVLSDYHLRACQPLSLLLLEGAVGGGGDILKPAGVV